MTEDVSALIDARLASLGDWRGEMLTRLRDYIRGADPEVVESVKWRKPTNPDGVPVWEYHGIICTGEVYKNYVKLTFMYGAALVDPTGIFNAGLDGGTRRAIDLKEGDAVDAVAFQALIREAIAHNVGKARK